MIKNLLEDDRPPDGDDPDLSSRSGQRADIFGFSEPEAADDEAGQPSEPFVLSDAPPESFAETARKSGLAWSAGIAFFASVVFMLVIGWLADLLLGSSPWGIVGGIILGSLIGFVQFFRITSQIFKK